MRILLGESEGVLGVAFYREDGGWSGGRADGSQDEVHEKGKGRKEDDMRIEVIPAAPEPKAVLNRPVLLNAEGKAEEAEQPKTLLQR